MKTLNILLLSYLLIIGSTVRQVAALDDCPDVDPSDETKPKAGSGTKATDCTDTKCKDDVAADIKKCTEAYYILNCAGACDAGYKAAAGADAQGDCPDTKKTDTCDASTCTGKTTTDCASDPTKDDCPGTCLVAANAAVSGGGGGDAGGTGVASTQPPNNCPDVNPADETKIKDGSGVKAKGCTDTKCTSEVTADISKCESDAYTILNCVDACKTAYKAQAGASTEGNCPNVAAGKVDASGTPATGCDDDTCTTTAQTLTDCSKDPAKVNCPVACLLAKSPLTSPNGAASSSDPNTGTTTTTGQNGERTTTDSDGKSTVATENENTEWWFLAIGIVLSLALIVGAFMLHSQVILNYFLRVIFLRQ